MRYLFHIGSPKAGSSVLQTLCARSRNRLVASGILFPEGTPHDEECMLAGRISAGNALHLAKQIQSGKWSAVRDALEGWEQEARTRKCNSILLSSEWLLGAFASNGRWVEFARILDEMQPGSTEILLVLRDPVDQLISLYKHRAKSGAAGSIRDWVEHGYDLPQQLKGIREQMSNRRESLIVKGYKNASGSLEALFFEQWLGVDSPRDSETVRVNPSLSLSELVLLRHLRSYHEGLVPFLYERLLAVDPALKVESPEMRRFARQVAANTVARYADEWRVWNAALPPEDRFEIPEPESSRCVEPDRLELSEEQFAAVMRLLAEATKLRLRVQLLWFDRLRPILSQIRRILFPFYWRR